jgi:Homeodomain-like domain
MHPQRVVQTALQLRAAGYSATEISRRIGVPRPTIRDWLGGKLPATQTRSPFACARCGHEHDLSELPRAYVYLLGLYLGDGCISPVHRGVYRMRIALDTRYPKIVASAAAAVTEIVRRPAHVQSRSGNWVEVSAYWKGWPCLFPQHGPGPKYARPIVLADWQLTLVRRWPEELLKGLIQSDGCRFQNTGRGGWSHPRYSFSQVSHDIIRIFCHACELIGVRWTRAGERTIYISRVADVAKLDEFIGPKC